IERNGRSSLPLITRHIIEVGAVGGFRQRKQLSSVFAGQKILRHDFEQQHGRGEAPQKYHEYRWPMIDTPMQAALVEVPHPVESAFAEIVKPVVPALTFGAQQPSAKHW